jgi:hypothetical protein
MNDRGVCDFGMSLLFGIWTLALIIDEECSEFYAGFIFSAIMVLSAVLFYRWGPLVYGYEGFNWAFPPFFAR